MEALTAQTDSLWDEAGALQNEVRRGTRAALRAPCRAAAPGSRTRVAAQVDRLEEEAAVLEARFRREKAEADR